MRQEGELAGTHEGEPGLPRGRSGLPAGEVREAQRERLLRAGIAAVDTTGFRNVTVSELVRTEVRRGAIDASNGLKDTLVALHLAVLAGRPWTQMRHTGR